VEIPLLRGAMRLAITEFGEPFAAPNISTERWYVMAEGKRGFTRDLIVGIILGLAVAVIAIATVYHLTHTVQRDARLVGLPLPVQTIPATVRTMHETIGASGTIQPSIPLTMTATVVAKVLEVPVDLGEVVKPGELLVRLDPQLYQASLVSAREALDHATKQLARTQALQQKQFASDVQVEQARDAEAKARDALIGAQINLENTVVRSPAPAVVLTRDVNPGEFTKLDQDLISLGVINPVMMVAEVSEDKLGAVYVGMQAQVGTDAYPGVTFDGTVAKIDSRINDSTRSFGAYIQLANPDLKLKKGVTGYARLESTKMALSVPSTAIMNPVGDRAAVFVVGKDHRAHLRQVLTGVSVGGMTEILSGVQEGEQVVTVGQYNLHDNDAVNVNHYGPWNG